MTVQARFWPWPSDKKSLKRFELIPLRVEAGTGKALSVETTVEARIRME